MTVSDIGRQICCDAQLASLPSVIASARPESRQEEKPHEAAREQRLRRARALISVTLRGSTEWVWMGAIALMMFLAWRTPKSKSYFGGDGMAEE